MAELKDGAGVVSRSFTHTPGGDTATITRASAPSLAYSYDARGRLSSVLSGPAQIASYTYDWREQRVSASSAEVGARHYLYAEDGQLLAEHDAATGALLREYVWLDTMPLAMVTGPAATPTYTWITTGNLNEPLLLTNAAGAITASTTRDPWGNPILLAGGEPLDLGYPGQWRDPATGLSQNWHRDYDPTLGRYIEADPLGLGGGSNVFAYVGGDPVNVTDPTGKCPWCIVMVGGFLMGAGMDLVFQGADNLAKGRQVLNPDCYDWENVLIAGGFGAAGGVVGRIAGGALRYGPRSLTRLTGREWSHTVPRQWINKYAPRWARPSMNQRGGLNGRWVTPQQHYRHDRFRYPSGWDQMPDRFEKEWLRALDRTPEWLRGIGAGAPIGVGVAEVSE